MIKKKDTYLKNNFSKKIFNTTTLFIVLTIFFLGSIVYYMLPRVNRVVYAVNPPKETQFKYAVSNPELLVPDFSDIDRQAFLNEIKQSTENAQPPSTNRLVIPKIGVDATILEGSGLDVLDRYQGVWREPYSGTPDIPSNMVLAGHRFQFLPPNRVTFYHLNQIKNGDRILVYWEEEGEMKDFVYEVYETLLVEPTDTFVRNHNRNNGREITLYTCGPEAGDNQKRIVVKAKQII